MSATSLTFLLDTAAFEHLFLNIRMVHESTNHGAAIVTRRGTFLEPFFFFLQCRSIHNQSYLICFVSHTYMYDLFSDFPNDQIG